MQSLITDIASFLPGSTINQVSKEWNKSIAENNQAILDGIMRKYRNAATIGDAARFAMDVGDTGTIRKLLTEYKGYLPILWGQFLYNRRNAFLLFPYLSDKEREKALQYAYPSYTQSNTYGVKNPDLLASSYPSREQEVVDSFIAKPFIGNFGFDERISTALKYGDIPVLQALIDSIGYDRVKELVNQTINRYQNQTGGTEQYMKSIPIETLKWLQDRKIINLDIPTLTGAHPKAVASFLRLRPREILLTNRVDLLQFLPLDLKVRLLRMSLLYDISPDIQQALSFDPDVLDQYLDTLEGKISWDKYETMPFGSTIEETILLHLLNLTRNLGVRDRIILIALKYGMVDILDRELNRDNILKYISKLPIGNLNPNTLLFLSYRNMNPKWFQAYFSGDSVKGIPESFWVKLLANAIVSGNLPLAREMIEKRPVAIDSDRKTKMIGLAGNNEVMKAFIMENT